MSVQAPAGNLYTSYFGLTEAPFSITPDPGYLYMSARHQEALAHLLFGISEGGGFVQLTGEIGTGKTTLCRYLVKQLPAHVDVALILNPRLTGPELLATACDELGIAYDRATTTPKGFVDALYRYLLDAHGRGRKTVLVIDEAQNLAPEVLEQIRLLTNLETEKDKLLQIILVGQPELAEVLASPRLRQLAQRITARYHLDPLSERETIGYVRHRLRIAGQKEQLFGRGAIREVYRLSGGVPRLINIICDRALLGAWSKGEAVVGPQVVRQAAGEVLGRRVRHPQAVAVAGIVLVGVLLTAGGVAWRLGAERLWGLVGLGAPPAAPARSETGGPARPTATSPPAVATPVSPAAAESAGPAEPASAPAPTGRDAGAAIPGPGGPPVPSLGTALERGDLHTDRVSAFRALYAAWGVPADERVEPGCEQAARLGLRCLFRVGTWYTLRRFDLPATLELLAPDGTRHFATVVAVDRDNATLAFGRDRRTAGLSEIERLWDGQFLLLWRPPGLRAIPLVPGMRGRDVQWLRQRLAEADGGPAAAADDAVFDDDLRERVVTFQASRGLIPDGIVGEETLTHLSAVTRPATVPRLSEPGK